MNLVNAMVEYLEPVLGNIEVCLGEWEDDQDDGASEYLSINFNGAPKPGVIADFPIIDLWYASPRTASDRAGGKSEAYAAIDRIFQYIKKNPKSSCFANVIPIAGIIGPRPSNEKRQVYKLTLQITV